MRSIFPITFFKIENRTFVVSLIIPLIILSQIRSSFTWLTTFYIASGLVVLLFILLYFGKTTIKFPNQLSVIALYASLTIFIFLNFQVSSLITLIAFIATFQLSDEIKKKSLEYLTILLSFIIGISLLSWLLHFNEIVAFPLYRLLDLSFIGTDAYLEDYLLFVHNPQLLFPRFYSVFEEPGGVGVLSAFVIIANSFNFKDKRVLIILGGLIFTYSLAGYVVFVSGLILNRMKSLRWLILLLIGISILFIILYYVFKDVEVLQMLIFDRITNLDERGLNHRTSNDSNVFFDSYCFSLSSIFGMGNGYCRTHFGGSSYKFFIIDYGWFGLLSIALLYLSIYKQYGKKALSVLFAFALAFLPQYGAFISWQILLFTISCFTVSKKYGT